MSLHDAYARLTPFELAFPDRGRLDGLVVAVIDEAARRGLDPTDPDAFAALESVGAFLLDLHGEDVPRVESIQHGVLLFHAVHFARAKCPLYLVDAVAARGWVRSAPKGSPAPPSDAGYVQLPQHLFWTEGVEGGPPESLDGLFWVVSGAERLHLLPIVGIRPDRGGFGALSIPDVPMAHAAGWMHENARERGADFVSRLPGADIDELYSVEVAGEVLKLLAWFFAHTSAGGTAKGEPSPVGGGVGPRPSTLSYIRVQLVA